jgi:hypothetical protein
MVRVAGLWAQGLSAIDHRAFARQIRLHDAERPAKGAVGR